MRQLRQRSDHRSSGRLARPVARGAHRAAGAGRRSSSDARDEIARERRELPWERVEQDVSSSTGRTGRRRSADLFEGRRPAHRLSLHVRSRGERRVPALLLLGRQLRRLRIQANTCISATRRSSRSRARRSTRSRRSSSEWGGASSGSPRAATTSTTTISCRSVRRT